MSHRRRITTGGRRSLIQGGLVAVRFRFHFGFHFRFIFGSFSVHFRFTFGSLSVHFRFDLARLRCEGVHGKCLRLATLCSWKLGNGHCRQFRESENGNASRHSRHSTRFSQDFLVFIYIFGNYFGIPKRFFKGTRKQKRNDSANFCRLNCPSNLLRLWKRLECCHISVNHDLQRCHISGRIISYHRGNNWAILECKESLASIKESWKTPNIGGNDSIAKKKGKKTKLEMSFWDLRSISSRILLNP